MKNTGPDRGLLLKKENSVVSLPTHATTLMDIKGQSVIIDIFIFPSNLKRYNGNKIC